MALGDSYAALAAAKAYLRVEDTQDDAQIERALSSASRAVEQFCGRQFNDAGSATERVFRPLTETVAWVDDFSTTDGLVIAADTGDTGTYDTTITDYTLHPLNGVSYEGVPGFAYHKIELASPSTWFRPHATRPSLQVTARWGWASVPDAVEHATLMLAAKMFGRRSSPHGAAVVGAGEFVFRVSRQTDPDVAEMLAPYRFDVPGVA